MKGLAQDKVVQLSQMQPQHGKYTIGVDVLRTPPSLYIPTSVKVTAASSRLHRGARTQKVQQVLHVRRPKHSCSPQNKH